MTIDGIFCNGRYRVTTVSCEMKMSHWLDAPVITRVEDGAIILDLSQDIWDMEEVREEGDVLVLLMRKYPGLTNGVEVRIFPDDDSFSIAGQNITRQELIAELSHFA